MNKKIIVSTVITIMAIFIAYFLIMRWIYPTMSSRGLFGDMFGGINALFSGLAFLGVIYTVILQMAELKLQRKELKMTRVELKRTAEAQEKSEQALSKQAESLRITAKLNGLSTLLNYNEIIRGIRERRGKSITEIDQESEHIAQTIKDIVDQK